ncbi:MAG TPA: hypothetical protein VFS25_15005 [Chitinophaga sp.]|jgi:hypothetical protein|uniref:hypothetical protein n=1 Tax=Chitinophaga sp. TaxID=1869181 RepID=UPI002DBCF7CC|nr:hypothetical protein [Chitinophaga sp.]HEU4554151.1 hypothetical protein [Chitinophaga sp.]
MHKFFSVKAETLQELDNAVNSFLAAHPDIVIVNCSQSMTPVGNTLEIVYSIIYKEGRQPTRIGYLGQQP